MTTHHDTHHDDSRRQQASVSDELSRSAQHARWIHSPDEHEERPGQTLATRSHDVIQRWAQERNAVPSTVPGSSHGATEGVLRFNFPGYGGERLEAISWDQFFKTFDERELVFLFQERLKSGAQSNFFHFDRAGKDDSAHSSRSRSGAKSADSKSESHSRGATGRASSRQSHGETRH